jgi:hypothetical protein
MGGFLKPNRQLDVATLLERVSKQAEEIAYLRFKLEQAQEELKDQAWRASRGFGVMSEEKRQAKRLLKNAFDAKTLRDTKVCVYEALKVLKWADDEGEG